MMREAGGLDGLEALDSLDSLDDLDILDGHSFTETLESGT